MSGHVRKFWSPSFFVEQWQWWPSWTFQLHMLPQLEDHQPNVMFQQDCAFPHCASIAQEFLDMQFPKHQVEHDGAFSGFRARPILCHLISSCAYTLRTFVNSSDELKLRIVAVIEIVTLQVLKNAWRKLNTTWTSYLSQKAHMLTLFSILKYWFYRYYNFMNYTFAFYKQFYFAVYGLKIIDISRSLPPGIGYHVLP